MPSLETILYIAGGLGVGAWLTEVIRSIGGYKTIKTQGQTTLNLQTQQIDATAQAELKSQVNRLMVEWQQVLIESKEREAQIGIKNYIIEDLNKKIAELLAREKEKDELIEELENKGK